jgi:small subunit ribosomal protein S11
LFSRLSIRSAPERSFSSYGRQWAEEKAPETTTIPSSSTTPTATSESSKAPSPSQSSSKPKRSNLGDLASVFGLSQATQSSKSTTSRDPFLDITGLASIGHSPLLQEDRYEEPHHLHIYATKHNTHITLTKPNRDPIISVSAGNIGFRKAARKHYDTAFQLAGYVMGRIQEQGLHAQIKNVEVILRGFGAGREAVTKALLGQEGRLLRGKIIKVSDSTRLKIGGTRSKKPRRLG